MDNNNNGKKFNLSIDTEALVTALKMWVSKLDGMDGGTYYVIDAIPYPVDLDAVVCWESVVGKFDALIGSGKTFDYAKILNGDADEIGSLDKWARDCAKGICAYYAEVLDRANALAAAEEGGTQAETAAEKPVEVKDNRIIAEYEIDGKLRAYVYDLGDINDVNHFFDDEERLVRAFAFTDKGDSEEDYYREIPVESAVKLVLSAEARLAAEERRTAV